MFNDDYSLPRLSAIYTSFVDQHCILHFSFDIGLIESLTDFIPIHSACGLFGAAYARLDSQSAKARYTI